MLRGKDAFRVEEHDSELHVFAELIGGAQLGRKDRLVFSRKAAVRAPDATYRATLKIIHGGFQANRFCSAIANINLTSSFGTIHVSLTNGALHVRVPIAAAQRKSWTRARSGNTYVVVRFGLPTEFTFGGTKIGEFLANLSVIREETNCR